MLKAISLLAMISGSALANLTIGDDQFQQSHENNCFYIARFELELSSSDTIELCHGSSPTPAMCYRFLSKAHDLELQRKHTIAICKRARSLMQKIDCVINLKENRSDYSADLAARECRGR